MAVEDHPLFPEWKDALQNLIDAKQRLELEGNSAEMRARVEDYNVALYQYIRVSEKL